MVSDIATLALVIGGTVILFLVARWYDRRRDVSAEYHAGQLSPKPPVSGGDSGEPVSPPVYRWVPHAVDQTRNLPHAEASGDNVDDSVEHGVW